MKKGLLKKSLALCCSITMLATSVPITNVSAADFTDDSVNVMVDSGGYKRGFWCKDRRLGTNLD